MSARDVIANAKIDLWGSTGEEATDAILSALTASGYRILGPDELDAVTVEKCAAVAENCPDTPFAESRRWHGNLRQSIPAAIRTLTAAQDEEE